MEGPNVNGVLFSNANQLGRILQSSGDSNNNNNSNYNTDVTAVDLLFRFSGIVILTIALLTYLCWGRLFRSRVDNDTSAQQNRSEAHIQVNFKSLLRKTTMKVGSKSLIRKEESSPELMAGDNILSGTDANSVVHDVELANSKPTPVAETKLDQEDTQEQSTFTNDRFDLSLPRQGLFPRSFFGSPAGTENMVLQLPEGNEDNGIRHEKVTGLGRLVPSTCAICLNSYQKGDRVSWSDSAECSHAFHTSCIVCYAETCSIKQQQQERNTGIAPTTKLVITVPCPLCRNTFVGCSVVRNTNSNEANNNEANNNETNNNETISNEDEQ